MVLAPKVCDNLLSLIEATRALILLRDRANTWSMLNDLIVLVEKQLKSMLPVEQNREFASQCSALLSALRVAVKHVIGNRDAAAVQQLDVVESLVCDGLGCERDVA